MKAALKRLGFGPCHHSESPPSATPGTSSGACPTKRSR
nr:hypothetical protein [Streptosporangium amethystogenes]